MAHSDTITKIATEYNLTTDDITGYINASPKCPDAPADVDATLTYMQKAMAWEAAEAEAKRREQAVADQAYEKGYAEYCTQARRAMAEPDVATDRQVDYILRLLATTEGAGFMNGPTTRDSIAKMTRRAASAYITSLKETY